MVCKVIRGDKSSKENPHTAPQGARKNALRELIDTSMDTHHNDLSKEATRRLEHILKHMVSFRSRQCHTMKYNLNSLTFQGDGFMVAYRPP